MFKFAVKLKLFSLVGQWILVDKQTSFDIYILHTYVSGAYLKFRHYLNTLYFYQYIIMVFIQTVNNKLCYLLF